MLIFSLANSSNLHRWKTLIFSPANSSNLHRWKTLIFSLTNSSNLHRWKTLIFSPANSSNLHRWKTLIFSLANSSNLHRWKILNTPNCNLCDEKQNQLHLLNNCSTELTEEEYTWRSDSVLYTLACLLKNPRKLRGRLRNLIQI